LAEAGIGWGISSTASGIYPVNAKYPVPAAMLSGILGW